MLKHFLCALTVLVAVLLPAPADACKCRHAPVCEEFGEAELVFIGRAERVTPLGPGAERTDFLVKEHLRGERVKDTVTVQAQGLGFSCERSFKQGLEYLVFTRKSGDGSWFVMLCSNTDTIDRVPPADMAYIRRALATRADGSLSGVGMIFRNTQYEPFVEAQVVLRSQSGEFVTRTNARGSYAFENIPPGDYSLEVTTPKHLAPIAPARIVIGNAACAYHVFTTKLR